MEFADTFYLTQYGQVYPIVLEVGRYDTYNNIYVCAHTIDPDTDEVIEPFCDLTINLTKLPDFEAAIDVHNNRGSDIIRFLEKNELGHLTGTVLSSGANDYPIFEFNEAGLMAVAYYEGKEKFKKPETCTVGLIEVGCAPRKVEIKTGNSNVLLDSLQELVGGRIDFFDTLYGDWPALVVNDKGISTCPVNRAVYATKRMEEEGYLSQMDFEHVAKEGELYTILFGNIVAISYDHLYNPISCIVREVPRNITDDEFEKLCRDFKDVGSGFKAVLGIMAQKQVQNV